MRDYLIDKLQKLQNRAARVITGTTYETRSHDVLKELHWQPLKERLKHKKLLFMRKIRNNELPISTTNMFDIKTNSRYNLRSNNRDFTWNKLPLEAKGLGITSQKFKSILDHYSPA